MEAEKAALGFEPHSRARTAHTPPRQYSSTTAKMGQGQVEIAVGRTVASLDNCIAMVQEPIVMKGNPNQNVDIATTGTKIYNSNNKQEWVNCGGIDVVCTTNKTNKISKGAININGIAVGIQLGTIVDAIEEGQNQRENIERAASTGNK